MAAQGVLGYCLGEPDARSLGPGWVVKGIYTGARILACIYLAVTNRKVRTKSFVLRHWACHLGNFSAML